MADDNLQAVRTATQQLLFIDEPEKYSFTKQHCPHFMRRAQGCPTCCFYSDRDQFVAMWKNFALPVQIFVPIRDTPHISGRIQIKLTFFEEHHL